MIIVDEHLVIAMLEGRRSWLGTEDTASVGTTWSFHFRLLRALSDEGLTGRLSGGIGTTLRLRATNPPSDLVTILDPRECTALAAQLARRHRLNVLAAELVAAAAHHEAEIVLSAGNVGRSWPDVFAEEKIRYRVV